MDIVFLDLDGKEISNRSMMVENKQNIPTTISQAVNQNIVFVDAPVGFLNKGTKSNPATTITRNNVSGTTASTSNINNNAIVTKYVDQPAIPKTLKDTDYATLDIEWGLECNITKIHAVIMKFMKNKKYRKEFIEQEICKLKFHLEDCDNKEIGEISSAINSYKDEIDKLNRFSAVEYINLVNPLLNEYEKIHNSGKLVIIGQLSSTDVNRDKSMIKIIEEYLTIAKKHYPMNIVRREINRGLCDNCNGVIVDKGDHYACLECQRMQQLIEVTPESAVFDDNNMKKSSNSNNVDNIGFRNVVLQACCRSSDVIPVEIIDKIKNSFAKLKSSIDIRTITHQDLLGTMKRLKLSNYYKLINKIHSILTDQPPFQISDRLLDRVFVRGDQFISIYPDIKGQEKTNFVNSLGLFLQFLLNEGFQPDMKYFVMLKSAEAEIKNIEVIKRGFDVLKKKHPNCPWVIYQIG